MNIGMARGGEWFGTQTSFDNPYFYTGSSGMQEGNMNDDEDEGENEEEDGENDEQMLNSPVIDVEDVRGEDSVQEMVDNEGDELVDIAIATDNLDDFEEELPYEEEPPWARLTDEEIDGAINRGLHEETYHEETIYVGQIFPNKDEFVHALREFSIAHDVRYKVLRTSPT